VNQVTKILKINSENQRDRVEEITLDMAYIMINICTNVFPKAKQITDCFHVQKISKSSCSKYSN
jgi:transposase